MKIENEIGVPERLAEVTKRVEIAATSVGRDPADVSLIAVSKSHPQSAARSVLEAGHRVFGENRVQEAEEKWPSLRERFPEILLHLIGSLQTNKAREAVALFDVIQTVDRGRLARALAIEMEKQARRPDVFVQVNTGEEPQKGGVLPLEADAFIRSCRDEFGLPVVGLMCIPPLEENPALHFALLGDIADRNGLGRLSMGMSADFEAAIRLGATEVRVGAAIFGDRSASPP